MDPKASEDDQARRDSRVTKALMAHQELQDQEDQMAKKAQWGCQETEEFQVSLVTLGPRVRRVQEDHKVLQELQAHRVFQALRG